MKCNYCHKEISGGGVTRMKEHLAAMVGDVAPCPNVPKEVRKLIREHLIKKRNEQSQGKLEKQRVQEELMSMPKQQNSDVGSDGNEDDRDIQHVFQASKESYISDERRRSGVGSSGVKRTDRSKSLRVDNGDKATNDDEVLNGWTNILERMVPDIAMQIEISKENETWCVWFCKSKTSS